MCVCMCMWIFSPKDLMRIEPYMTLRNTKRRIHSRSHTRAHRQIYVFIQNTFAGRHICCCKQTNEKKIAINKETEKNGQKNYTNYEKKANKHDNLCVYNDFIKKRAPKMVVYFSPRPKETMKISIEIEKWNNIIIIYKKEKTIYV